jgi:hypothetical protein
LGERGELRHGFCLPLACSMLNLNLSCSVMERADRILVTSFAIQSYLDGRASPSVRVCRHEPEFRFSPDLSKRAMLQIGDAGSFICLDFRLIGALTFGFFCMLALKCARQGAVVGKPKKV